MISLLPEPAATVVATAGFTGLRRSGLGALRWEAYNGDEIYVRVSRRWNGIETEPKTKKSKAPIPIIKPLAARLEFHRARLGDPIAGPMWPNAEEQPMCLNNLLERVILRTLNRCATCHKSEAEHAKHPAKFADHKYERDNSIVAWHGWHAFRRGLSTTLHELSVPSETIQKIMRHEDVATTQKH